MSDKPILCLDFDGVIHSYTSGWQGAEEIPDPPVPGAIQFIAKARAYFRICIYSSRSKNPKAITMMKLWLARHAEEHLRDGYSWMLKAMVDDPDLGNPTELDHMISGLVRGFMDDIEWPYTKPAAFVTLDDRAITFTGTWPDLQELLKFKPWHQKEKYDV